MWEILGVLGTFALITLITLGVLILFLCGVYKLTSGTYEYIDLNNKKGIAENCFDNDAYSTCYKKDGTVIKVKEYRQAK